MEPTGGRRRVTKRGADAEYSGPQSDLYRAYQRMKLVTGSLERRGMAAYALMMREIGKPSGGLQPSAYVNNWLALDSILRDARRVLAFLLQQYTWEREGRYAAMGFPGVRRPQGADQEPVRKCRRCGEPLRRAKVSYCERCRPIRKRITNRRASKRHYKVHGVEMRASQRRAYAERVHPGEAEQVQEKGESTE